jgi:hypothetical protein
MEMIADFATLAAADTLLADRYDWLANWLDVCRQSLLADHCREKCAAIRKRIERMKTEYEKSNGKGKLL